MDSVAQEVFSGDGGPEREPLLKDKSGDVFPPAPWTRAIVSKEGFKLPQAIGHRGYKAKHPENTMAAFRGAAEVGAHALETDIHLTKDNVVVLSHDPTLNRCFGKPDKIIDVDWEYVSSLQTIMAPHLPMPRLAELLEYLAKPEQAHLWLLLDIKTDNNADDVMRLMGETIESVKPANGRPWNKRVVLGCWAPKFLPFAEKYLPGFPVSNIAFSTGYARQFLPIPNVSFNLLQFALVGPLGGRFLRKVKKLNRPVFDWTVNTEKNMQWSISKEMDGVITDNPELFLEVCDKWTSKPRHPKYTVRELFTFLRFQLMIAFFVLLFKWRVGTGVDKKYTRRIKDRKSA